MMTSPLALLLLLMFQEPPIPAGKISFDDLLHSLADMDWLTTIPPEGERCIQFSSYDRASHGKDNKPATKDDAGWYANGDAGQFIREEKVGDKMEYVMADVDGPGAVVRIWSANANDAGNLHFYFDGEEKPSFIIPFVDLAGGKKEPFVEPFCGVHARGWNCYIPFPFAKHLKISATKKSFYYHVNVRLFGKGMTTETFREGMLKSEAIEQTSKRLTNNTGNITEQSFSGSLNQYNLQPGETKQLEFDGWGTIRSIIIFLEKPSRESYKSIRLQITFDGAKLPSVDCPLGDFFGSAPDMTEFKTYPISIGKLLADGRNMGCCNFPMPFENGATISFTNEGAKPTSLLAMARIDKKSPGPLRFHAKYNQSVNLKTHPRSDYLILDAKGPGRFVGCSLSVRNPVRAWWGEGDEHAYVDGEIFPSTFGTGTEDYFGYAWCDPTPFQAAFHSQSRCDGPDNRGFTSVNRFHIGDSIPFQKSFKFDLEVWHWANTNVDYASVAYWYAPANATDAMPPMPNAKDRIPRDMPAIASKFPGSIEGELLVNSVKPSGGKIQIQDMAGFGEAWSRDEHLWWTGAKAGDKLEIPFEVTETANYAISGQFTKAADYGIVNFTVDGREFGKPFDGYNNGVVASGDFIVGNADLTAGKHIFTILCAGKNDKALPGYMFGLDYLRLIKK